MRRLFSLFVTILIIALFLTVPVQAAGGKGNKSTDVCWMRSGGIEVMAYFRTTGSGIVQEFRYEPEDAHVIFKPISKFPEEPDEGDWFMWTAPAYTACAGETDLISDFLPVGETYWVKIVLQN